MTKKRTLKSILPALLCVICLGHARAQYAPYTPYRLSVHITNPLSLLSKFGGRLQYRLSPLHSVVLSYRNYYGFFPGYQAYGAYQRYFSVQGNNEFFLYGKVGIGNADYAPKPYYSGAEDPFGNPGGYLFAGAGIGKRYNIGHFFIEANVGLKYAGLMEEKEDYNRNLFYSLGPASFLDCGIHIGLQFFDEERNGFRHTLAPHKPRTHY